MKKSKQCPKCDSLSVMRYEGNDEELYFCADCGYQESYYRAPKEFAAALEKDTDRVQWLNRQPDARGPYR